MKIENVIAQKHSVIASLLSGRKLAVLNQPGLKTSIMALDAERKPNFHTRIEIHHATKAAPVEVNDGITGGNDGGKAEGTSLRDSEDSVSGSIRG